MDRTGVSSLEIIAQTSDSLEDNVNEVMKDLQNDYYSFSVNNSYYKEWKNGKFVWPIIVNVLIIAVVTLRNRIIEYIEDFLS